MLGKPHSNTVAQILSISLAQETEQEQVINLVIHMTFFHGHSILYVPLYGFKLSCVFQKRTVLFPTR